MISQKHFDESVNKFDELEMRTDFFKLARNLILGGFEKEGLLLILSTWNFASFRYAVKEFDIVEFERILKSLKQHFKSFENKQLQALDIDLYSNEIKIIFNSLSKIKGIEFTGASKLMHLINPDVFVMWDGYICGDKPKKYYAQLDVYKNGDFIYKKYLTTYEGYIEFLKDMKEKFKHLLPPEKLSFAKAIDEFNYVNITLEYQNIEKKIKLKKKENESAGI